ncbi:DMT family transporter [Butyrivibrio sp. MC2013]|uniref:DMT family transporter n=1 Tax=Butyrivibrio sp. MC2013 TaxID=1280686 RepID=UPI00041CCF6B|nr:DMT family transporter [Butyrivibrio sp. MC2013]
MSNNRSSSSIIHSLLLLLAAFIWGFAFVAQSAGGDAVGPYTFNCVRSLIGCLVLYIVIRVRDMIQGKTTVKSSSENAGRKISPAGLSGGYLKGGIICGSILFISSTLQQLGINMGAGAGRGGFLTAAYILIVPILGLFMHRKCGINVWAGVAVALAGMYLLCIYGKNEAAGAGDLLLILCAVGFSFHIIFVDKFAPNLDGIKLSCIQFLVAGILGIIPMSVFEMGIVRGNISDWINNLMDMGALIPILYAGVLSCAVAYTLQIIGQEHVEPALASLIMSFESVFALIGGMLLLGERMALHEAIGCILMFLAILLAQGIIRLPAHPDAA